MPRFSQSLEYGVALLECFTAAPPALQISELADMIELSRTTTHRYARTLARLDYLRQDQRRRYLLSQGAVGPGMAMIGTIRLEAPTAPKILENLRNQTGHTVSMGALNGTYATYLYRFFSHRAGQYVADLQHGVGAHVPTHCTAIGKALLASLSEPEQRATLACLTLDREGPNTIVSKRALAEELDHVRTQGVAVCDEEQADGVRSIAAVIPQPGRSRPFAVSVTVPAQHYTLKAMIATLGPHVKAAAAHI
jgi:DNA-binding IclR family transcriptional regulator